MKLYRLFADDTPLTPIANLIMAEDLEGLAQQMKDGWDINAVLPICRYIDERPIVLVLVENRLKVLDWLLARGLELNAAGTHAMVTAASNCSADTLRFLVAHGAKVDAVDRVGKNAFSAALYADRYDLLPVLVDLGLRVDADGGRSFRQAVSHGQYPAVNFFLAQGIDVNQRAPDMVFPYNSTAVAVAASKSNIEMVKLLVAHGADVTVKDGFGFRPFILALKNRDEPMQAYLRELEPPEWHDDDWRASQLAKYRLPHGLLSVLRSGNRRMKFDYVGAIEFHRLANVEETLWEGHHFLHLLAHAEDYGEEILVWSPADRKLAFADFEHGAFHPLCTWEEFVGAPGKDWWSAVL
jgi:uncharacterized protein